MTEVTVHRGPVVPKYLFIVGNLVEPIGDNNNYVVIITDVQDNKTTFTGTVIVPDNAYHSQVGYVSDGFTKRCFKQFVGSVTLKV